MNIKTEAERQKALRENKERCLSAIKRLADDPQRVTVDIGKYDLWSLLTFIQLALRHPKASVGPTAKIVRPVADQLAGLLTKDNPDLADLWEMGKKKEFDQP